MCTTPSALSHLLKRAASGEDIVIARSGEPVARLTRLSRRRSTAMIGAFAGKLHMVDDFDAIPAEFGPYLTNLRS